ncbi:thioredoxin-dependent thiol peroxidase [Arsenicicoccus sp. oral taxon 190]|uniref:thioredoxin-dependent thiol peroxidase n=1 Tax=Arsenicicoccus sp. oral taxon 190 TaxID=1658671 RepID=UPI00067A2C41|nr:thioredoxin-dependent thiol peroxidase [Arsenicicoccus sp. oral taxon 190]AKT51491.1 peroxiredoxin [Arsenicicoccus sp. oral taxon 190]
MARLEPGDQAPDFTLPSDTGEQVSLRDLRGRKLVLFFYPAAMTPGCTTEACDFRDSLGALQAAGYEVVGISKDEPARLARFREKEGLTYPLLGDPSLEVLKAYGAYGEKQNYGKTVQGVIRSTIVLDEDGTVTLARYNIKAKGHVASLSKALGLGA